MELHLLSYSAAQDQAWSAPILPEELKHMGEHTVQTSIFDNKKKVPIMESHTVTDYDAPDDSRLMRPSGDKFSAPRPTKQVFRETGEFIDTGSFRKPSDIIARHLVKMAGHYLGYGVYVALGAVGVALDAEFARQLYSVVYAKSLYPFSRITGQMGLGYTEDTVSTLEREEGMQSDYDKVDLDDDEALKFLNDIIATNASFTRASDQELIIPMPGAEGSVQAESPLNDKSFWQQTKEALTFSQQEPPPVPTSIEIPESVLVTAYQKFFTDTGICSFHLEHYDSRQGEIEGLEIAQSQTDGRTYVDSENPKPNANQQALASSDDDAPFVPVPPADELIANTVRGGGFFNSGDHRLGPSLPPLRKRIKGKSLTTSDSDGEWKAHPKPLLSDWTDAALKSIIEGRTPAVPIVRDKVMLEDGTIWEGFRSKYDVSQGISSYTTYLSDVGQAQVQAILDARTAAKTAIATDAKKTTGVEPLSPTQRAGFADEYRRLNEQLSQALAESKKEDKGYIQTEFSRSRLYGAMRTICGAIWNKVGANVGKGLRISIEETGYLETDEEYNSYLADRGNFMTSEKLKALFGVVYIAPKDNETFNHKAVPPPRIKSFDIELPDINVGEGETIPIQLSYGFQKRFDSIVKTLDIQLESGQLNNMLHVQPEVISKAFDLVKLHSANFTNNIGQITNSMVYILTQNSDVTTTIDEDSIALHKRQNYNEIVVREGSIAFSQRAIRMIFETVANYAADPTKFVGTNKDLSDEDRAVYESHLKTLMLNLGFLSKGANDYDTEWLTDIFFGPAEFGDKKVEFFIGGDKEDVLGNATIEPFKVLVPQTWDSDPISNGAVKAQIAKLAAYRQLRNVLDGIKVTTLGIPELNRHMSEVNNRLVYLRINNPRDLGTLHWASGYYKLASISHDISTNGGYITNLELFVSHFQTQGALANFEQASAEGEAHRGTQ